MKQQEQYSVNVCGLLLVLFIAFKLAGIITWPWVWVLAPAWGPLALVAALLACMLLVACMAGVFGLVVTGIRRK